MSDDHPPLCSVVVVDNQPIVRTGVEAVLQAAGGFSLVGSYGDLDSIPLGDPPPQVVVLDLWLGRDDELTTPWIPRLRSWGAAVLLHSSDDRPWRLREAMAAGAGGLILKNDPDDVLVEAIREVAVGIFHCSSEMAHAIITDPRLIPRLSPREVEILAALDDGLTQRQTGRRLGIDPETVKAHLKSVRHKYEEVQRDVTNSSSLVREAHKDGWLKHRPILPKDPAASRDEQTSVDDDPTSPEDGPPAPQKGDSR